MTVKSILYVTTQVTGTWRYFSWCSYPSIWYCRIQRRVLNVLSSCKDIDVSIKFYPNDLLENPNKNAGGGDSCRLLFLQNSLLKILEENDFDLIVTEACATTLLEILCTKSQILCFFPKEYLKLDENAVKLLMKRVYFTTSEDVYVKSLKSLLDENPKMIKKELNDEFLFRFGIDSLENRPVVLEKGYINSIIGSEK